MPLKYKNLPKYSIIKKSRFFEVLDTKDPNNNIEKIIKNYDITRSTAYK